MSEYNINVTVVHDPQNLQLIDVTLSDDPIAGIAVTVTEDPTVSPEITVDVQEGLDVWPTIDVTISEDIVTYPQVNVVVNDFTGSSESAGGGGIPEAPLDGQQYGRQSGAWTVVSGGGGDGRGLLARVQYDVGSHTFSIGDYPGATEIVVKMTGGGGGGGGCGTPSGTQVAAGGGGGAAASAEFVVPVGSLSASESITVGAGGAGGVGASNGSAGTNTTGFGWTMGGGNGGQQFLNTDSDYRVARGGVGGGVTTGLGTALNSTDGGWGLPSQAWALYRPAGGNGGDSMLGVGGRGANGITSSGQDGANGYGNGSGGGGGANRPGQTTARNGGDGADGIVLIEVWAVVSGGGGGGGSFDGEHVLTGDPSDPAVVESVAEGQLLYDGVESDGSGGGPHDHDDYLPLSGGTVTGDLQVDGVTTTTGLDAKANGAASATNPNITFGTSSVNAQTGFFRNSTGAVQVACEGEQVWRFTKSTAIVYNDLQVNGTINGTLAFGIADGIDTAEVLDRAEVATMPAVDDEGVATTDAEVESVTVNEVVTALLSKVKELSARIEELEGA